MKVRLENATAGQLRAFIKAQWAIPTAPNATVKSLRNKLSMLGFDADEFELFETDEMAIEGDDDTSEATADQAVRTLVASGWDETAARSMLNLAEAGRTAMRLSQVRASRAKGEKPYGPGKEEDYYTVNIASGSEDDGGFDALLQVNGRRKDVPRGVDWPLNSIYIECLDHAERKVYEEVFIRDDLPRRYVPRIVLKYPYQIVDGPYDREEFERRSAEAEAEMRARHGNLTHDLASAQSAQTQQTMLRDLSAV